MPLVGVRRRRWSRRDCESFCFVIVFFLVFICFLLQTFGRREATGLYRKRSTQRETDIAIVLAIRSMRYSELPAKIVAGRFLCSLLLTVILLRIGGNVKVFGLPVRFYCYLVCIHTTLRQSLRNSIRHESRSKLDG